jgi:dihydroxyacetone kinase-like predicted kinase
LLKGQGLDHDAIHEWVAEAGGSELVVGDDAILKVHVHTDDPASVLSRATGLGEVAQVHINNMREQTAQRQEDLKSRATPEKPLGTVAISAGPGMTDILKSLGVDEIVDGGQTMNPSTAQIAEAIERVPAAAVIVLPNNKNIVMAAQQASEVTDRDVRVVPTHSVLQAFAALLALDPEADPDDAVAEMTEAADAVRVAEVTTAVKDSTGAKVGDIGTGQIIGISQGEIEVVGEDVMDVAEEVLAVIVDGADTLTVLAGQDFSDEQLEDLVERFTARYPELEIDALRGDQPLYPVLLAAE